jgi:hypothetical protein
MLSTTRRSYAVGLMWFCAILSVSGAAQVGVSTYHNNKQRTGNNRRAHRRQRQSFTLGRGTN